MATTSLPYTATAERVYIRYIRVSTEKQERDGYGPDRQRSEIADYCTRNGITVSNEYLDDVSGTLESRPNLDRALAQVRAGRVAGILIAHPDRLSREAWIGMKLLKELHMRGLEVHFVNLGAIPNTDEARFNVAIHFCVSELDKGNLMRKLNGSKRAKVTHATDPRPLNMGIPPLGYRYTGHKKTAKIEIVEREATIVRRIYAMYLAGASIPTIVATFAREGVPTVEDIRPRTIKTSGIKRRGYAQWNRFTIHRILQNPIYKGKLAAYRTVGNVVQADGTVIKRATKKLSDDSIVWLNVDPIIDPAQWEAAQRQRNDRRREATDRYPYLLTHRLRCTCGYARYGWLQGRPPGAPEETPRRPYYRCCGQTGGAVHRCRSGMVQADRLDDQVWEYVETVLLDPENLRQAFAAQTAMHEAARAEWEQERSELRAALADIGEQKAELLKIELDPKRRGNYSAALLAKTHAELDALAEQYQHSYAELESRGAQGTSWAQWDSVDSLLRTIHETIDTTTVAGRRQVLAVLGVTVIADKQTRRVHAEIDAERGLVEVGSGGPKNLKPLQRS